MTKTLKPKPNRQNLPVGDVVSWEKTAHGIKGQTAVASFELTFYNPKTLRVQVSQEEGFSPNPYAVIKTPEKVNFKFENRVESLWLSSSDLDIRVKLYPFHLTFYSKDGTLLNEDDPSFSISWLGTEVSNYKKVQKEEKFIGLGEKTGNLNRAGKAYTNWNTDYFAYGVGDDPLYMSIPFYIGVHSEKAYGIFFDNSHKTVFNFGASNNRFIYYSADDGDMDYYFFHDDTVGGIIESYSDLTGKMEMPPLWSLGFQQCRYSYYPASEVLNVANTFRDKNMPADVIYLDIHHMEKYKVFTFDGEKFPDPTSMIQRLNEKGFKVVVIMDPGIKNDAGYLPYEEGKQKDLFVKYPDGEIYEGQVWPGWCAFPDFTKAETRRWWAEKMEFYHEVGVAGYWTDMNEPASWGQFTPNLINFHYEGEKVSHRKARNIYGMQMARSAREGSLLQAPDQRPFVLTRAGFSGIQRYAAAWTGDNVSSEEHMLAGVRLVNSLGISGIPFSGYDVGGFAGEASKSLFARWMSIATFAPLYRAHSMINSSDAEPWTFGEEVEEISRNYMKLRYRLLPMIYSAFHVASKTGLPVAKSLAIDYPHDPKVFDSNFQNQYLFCNNLLIAPVESTKDITKVYLPRGDWYYFFDDHKHEGNTVIYQDCPISYLPIFVKGGSVIAMQSDISHTGQHHDGILRLHVYKGKGKTLNVHYEDDGITNTYQRGDFYKRTIVWDSDTQQLSFGAVEGNIPSKFSFIKIYLHGMNLEKAVMQGDDLPISRENFAFLDKLTEFDPLPEHSHPYFHISNLLDVTIENMEDAFSIQFIS